MNIFHRFFRLLFVLMFSFIVEKIARKITHTLKLLVLSQKFHYFWPLLRVTVIGLGSNHISKLVSYSFIVSFGVFPSICFIIRFVWLKISCFCFLSQFLLSVSFLYSSSRNCWYWIACFPDTTYALSRITFFSAY